MPIYILDENFNLVSEVQLDNPLTDFEYVDGVYYIETQEYTQVGTTDYELKNNTIYYYLMMRLIGNLIMKWVIYRKATAEIISYFKENW